MSPHNSYSDWNEAIGLIVYSPERAGQPTYLDLEDDVLEAIQVVLDDHAPDRTSGLMAAVRGTLRFGNGPAQVLGWHMGMLKRWQTAATLDTPPNLALLAALSCAAENMKAEDGTSANNFYIQFQRLLGLSENEKTEFTRAYQRKDAEGVGTSRELWAALNAWLERLEGTRGLPTAHGGKLAHIGTALSQAMVRQTDRDKLPDLFASFGLPPSSYTSPDEMAIFVDEWLHRNPCPVSKSLERLWKDDRGVNGGGRERIVDVVCQALATWDGTGATGDVHEGSAKRRLGAVRMNLAVVTFPVSKVEIGVAIATATSSPSEMLDLFDQDENTLGSIEFHRAGAGWITFGDPDALDMGSLLSAFSTFRQSDGTLHSRKPRRLVTLRKDELLTTFVEVERAGLGDDMVLLCTADLAKDLTDVLDAVARPGWRLVKDMRGLPSGWDACFNVQILSSIPEQMFKKLKIDLHALQPFTRTGVGLDGGMKLPGSIEKYSHFRAPELRVTTEDSTGVDVQITCSRPLVNPPPRNYARHFDQPALVWDLSSLDLPDGDYQVAVTESDGSGGQAKVLRLRSADNPAIHIKGEDRDLGRLQFDPWSVCSAVSMLEAQEFTIGLQDQTPSTFHTSTSVPGWFEARQRPAGHAAASSAIRFPVPIEGSCMLTGAHYMEVETGDPGQLEVGGRCRDCGLVKRYRTRPKVRRSSKEPARAQRTAPVLDIRSIDPVPRGADIDIKVGFDALCHIGFGPYSSLQQVAMQLEPSAMFVDVFTRGIEAFGHLEVERDPATLRPSAWSITPPRIIGLPDGRCVLTGHRSERLSVAVEDVLYELGIDFEKTAMDWTIERFRIDTEDLLQMRSISDALNEALDLSIPVLPDAAINLANSLAPLSRVRDALPATSALRGREIERWNVGTARFEECEDASLKGAYRIENFGRSYVYRRTEDIGAMTAVLGDARLVKHIAALEAGVPLAGYDAEHDVLYVPLGADLPGLYGRAAIWAIGRLPTENQDENILEYHNVNPELAGTLMHLLST